MKSVVEISVSGDSFLFLNNMSSQQLEQIKNLSEQFRDYHIPRETTDTQKILENFIDRVEKTLRIKLYPVSIISVITLK